MNLNLRSNRDDNRRRRLFYFACLPTRLLFALLPLSYLYVSAPYAARVSTAAFFLILSSGFLFNYASHKRTGFLGGTVWWQANRVWHMCAFSNAAFLLIVAMSRSALALMLASFFLFSSVTFGAVSGSHHYQRQQRQGGEVEGALAHD